MSTVLRWLANWASEGRTGTNILNDYEGNREKLEGSICALSEPWTKSHSMQSCNLSLEDEPAASATE
ncbi:uncharacterized protein N7511_007697 [Penicillium nucicola]|uniref:uncharacterized protein n=1 Tax=Penicillium nucicola TaxID=1850975 RepID=UPI0025457757|nr:uncharacterized protein N7511_007697 [Penicillium nucicola]KAJ5753544.1 hypothetical protein N7511_007697 [Penicillium nucicola]